MYTYYISIIRMVYSLYWVKLNSYVLSNRSRINSYCLIEIPVLYDVLHSYRFSNKTVNTIVNRICQ